VSRFYFLKSAEKNTWERYLQDCGPVLRGKEGSVKKKGFSITYGGGGEALGGFGCFDKRKDAARIFTGVYYVWEKFEIRIGIVGERRIRWRKGGRDFSLFRGRGRLLLLKTLLSSSFGKGGKPHQGKDHPLLGGGSGFL